MKASEQQQSKLLFSKSKNTYGQLVHKVLNLEMKHGCAPEITALCSNARLPLS